MLWTEALVRVQGGEWTAARRNPTTARPAHRFAMARQMGQAAPSRRELIAQAQEAREQATAAKAAAAKVAAAAATRSQDQAAAAAEASYLKDMPSTYSPSGVFPLLSLWVVSI